MGPTAGTLNRMWDTLGAYGEMPSWMESVCEADGKFYHVQGIALRGTVDALDEIAYDEGMRLLPKEFIRELTIGDPLPYIFAMLEQDGSVRLIVGNRKEVAAQLKAELENLDRYPNVKADVADFINTIDRLEP
jgi:hypothetical protein